MWDESQRGLARPLPLGGSDKSVGELSCHRWLHPLILMSLDLPTTVHDMLCAPTPKLLLAGRSMEACHKLRSGLETFELHPEKGYRATRDRYLCLLLRSKKGITPKIESPPFAPYSDRGDEGGRCVTISPNN